MTDSPAIEVRQMTKFYGKRSGIVDFSATVERGSLVGLLGPNGAGKTTTIRVLTCHMPPTSGHVQVCGFNVLTHSMEVRKRLGYLPENCPLYPEMRVIEYLTWTAAMKGLTGSDVSRAVYETLGPCGIDHVRTQPIRTLSKGYRQRVGLASALVSKPEIVILDEPTIGLDPVQIREFRSLIGSLKGKHTVLISSHILTEIEMLCDSVIILNEGRVVAAGTPQSLRGEVTTYYSVECRAHPTLLALLPRLVSRLPGVSLEKYDEAGDFAKFRLSSDKTDPRLEIAAILREAGIEIRELHQERVTLEDAFIRHIKTSPQKTASPPNAEQEAPQ